MRARASFLWEMGGLGWCTMDWRSVTSRRHIKRRVFALYYDTPFERRHWSYTLAHAPSPPRCRPPRLPPARTSSRLPRASSPYVSRGLSSPPTAGSRAWRLAGDAEPSCRGRSSCGNCQPGLLVCGGRVGVGGGAHTGEVWRLDLGSFGWSVFDPMRCSCVLRGEGRHRRVGCRTRTKNCERGDFGA